MEGEVIKWFDDKGYGFVKSGNETYFLHISEMENQDKPSIGDTISFDVVKTERGQQAQKARII